MPVGATCGLLPSWRRRASQIAPISISRRVLGPVSPSFGWPARAPRRLGKCARSMAGDRPGSSRVRPRWPTRGRSPARNAALRTFHGGGAEDLGLLTDPGRYRRARCRTSKGRRAGRGGRWISNVLIRYHRSSRKSPASTIVSRCRWVAQRRASQVNDSFRQLVEPRRFPETAAWPASTWAVLPIVQKQGPRRPPEQADAVLIRGEGRFLAMPEQLAFDQVLGQAPQLIGTNGLSGTQTLVVGGGRPVPCRSPSLPRIKTVDSVATLSSSCLTPAIARDRRPGRSPFDPLQPLLQGEVLLVQLAPFGHAGEDRPELDQPAWLGQIVKCPVRSGNRRLQRALAGEYDRVGRRLPAPWPWQSLDAVQARHVQVDENAVVGVFSSAAAAVKTSGQTVTSWPIRGSSNRINSWSDGSSSANRSLREVADRPSACL